MKRLGGDTPVAAPTAPKQGGGVMREDVGQWGGPFKVVLYLFLLALFVGLFTLCFQLASGS